MDTPEYDCGNPDANGGTIPDADSTFGGAGSDPAGLVHTSRLAVVACILGAVSLLLVPGLIVIASMRTGAREALVRDLYQMIMEAVALGAVLLGLTSAIRIELSGGRLAGRGFAWIAVAVPVTQWFLFALLHTLARTECRAFRMTCPTNLSGIGKAMLIYANDYEDELPRAGGRNSVWGPVKDWLAPNRWMAYGVNPQTGAGGAATISSCFYLLVKYAEVTPKSFICKGDIGATEFKPDDLPRHTVPRNFELIDGWDFGPPGESMKHCSYSYHFPFGLYALTTASEPGFAVATERNPWMDSPFAQAQDFSKFKPDIAGHGGTNEQARCGNAMSHQREGQNVLYLDSHVAFEKRPYCSIDDDNIYTVSARPPQADPWGTPPNLGSRPACRKDSLLVNDPPQLLEKAEAGSSLISKPTVRRE
jgi:hypothetical protein